MRDLRFLFETNPPQEEPGLSTTDERLAEISALADDESYDQAADRVEALVAEGVIDIRLLVFVVYDALLEGGPRALLEGLKGLESLMSTSSGAVGPKERREAFVGRSLRWLFDTTADMLTYEEQRRTDRFQAWSEALSAEDCRHLLETMTRLVEAAGQPAVEATTESSARLTRWLRDAMARLDEAKPAATDAEPAPEPKPTAASGPRPGAAVRPPEASSASYQVRGSVKLVALVRKLEAFERLVEKRSFEKAALVGDDVLTQLDRFDPREYFPELFSEFGALLSSHVQDITPFWDHKESVRWRMLEQFYKVDLDRFVEE